MGDLETMGAVVKERAFVEALAKICHEVNAAYCLAFGDHSQLSWDKAPNWQKESCIEGVLFHLGHPDAGPEASHENWLKTKEAGGWSWGPIKDADNKKHPCCRPFIELPPEQKAKDYIFRQIVHSLRK